MTQPWGQPHNLRDLTAYKPRSGLMPAGGHAELKQVDRHTDVMSAIPEVKLTWKTIRCLKFVDACERAKPERRLRKIAKKKKIKQWQYSGFDRQSRKHVDFDSTCGYPGEGPACLCKHDNAGHEVDGILKGVKSLPCRHAQDCWLNGHRHYRKKEGAARRVREAANKENARKTVKEVRQAKLVMCDYVVPQDGCDKHYHTDKVGRHACADSPVIEGKWDNVVVPPVQQDVPAQSVNAMRTPAMGDQDHLQNAPSRPATPPPMPAVIQLDDQAKAGASATVASFGPLPPAPPPPQLPAPVPAPPVMVAQQVAVVPAPLVVQVVMPPLRLARCRLFVSACSRERGPTVAAAAAAWLGSRIATNRQMRVNQVAPGHMLEQLQLENAEDVDFVPGVNFQHIGLPHAVADRTGVQHPNDDSTFSVLSLYYRQSYMGEFYQDVVAEALVDKLVAKFTIIKGDGSINASLESAIKKFTSEHPRYADMSQWDSYERYMNTIVRIANLLIIRGVRLHAACNPLSSTQILNRRGGLTGLRSRNAPSIESTPSTVLPESLSRTITHFGRRLEAIFL